jgi:hypothetical protein
MAMDPISDPHILEALEACRAGSDDVSDLAMDSLRHELSKSAELRDAYGRLQRLDQVLVDAFHDVPIPEGLADRILNRLKSAKLPPESSVPDVSQDVASVCDRAAARKTNRRWLFGLVAVASAAILLVGVAIRLRSSSQLRLPDVLNLAIEFRMNGGGNHAQGGGVASDAARELPLSPALASLLGFDQRQLAEIPWRSIDGFLGCKAVAYDLVGPRGITATVYAAECSVGGLTSEVPLRAMLSTGQYAAAAWQEGGLLYVLVVDGGDRMYEQFVTANTGPLT